MGILDAFRVENNFMDNLRRQWKAQKIARIASSIVISISYLVLVGWKLEITSLKSVIPGLATMKVNAAFCFVWAGISLWLLAYQARRSIKAQIINVCAIVIVIVASLTICQYILGWNLGIDELIFSDPGSPATSHPGRMGINTAVNFGLTGAALWLLNHHDRPSSHPQPRVDPIAIAQSLALIVGMIAIQAIVGYAYNVRVFYQLTTLTTSMALHTAVCFGVLAVGMLALRSDRGWMRSLTANLMGGDIARRFIPMAIVLPLAIGWLILQGLNANLYDPNFAMSLMSMSLITIALGLIAKNAGTINRIDYDRIRSDDRMRSSEERLKLALQGAGQGTWDFNLQTQELVWDDRCKEMFGLSTDAIVNYESYLAGLYPDDRQRVAEALATAERNCGEFVQEYRTVHSDGMNHWILTKGQCLCDSAGASRRMSGTMMEITDRKIAELNERFLYELTRRLRLITDADELEDEAARSIGEYLRADRATWVRIDWSKRQATVARDWCQAGFATYTGVYAIAEFLPPAMQVDLFTGESVIIRDVYSEASLMPYLASYSQLGVQAFVNIPCFNENQWVALLQINSDRVRNWREDEINLLQAVAAQIWPTLEQARAVQALRAQEEQTCAAQAIIKQQLDQIEAIYQAAPIGLCFVDTDLRYVRINEQLAQINGASVAAHIGHTLRELLPELADDAESIYRQVIESGIPIVDLEMSGTNPAQPGVVRSWVSSFYPQTDRENRTIGVNTVVQEITDRKRDEERLRQSEEFNRRILESNRDCIKVMDLSGRLTYMNDYGLSLMEINDFSTVVRTQWLDFWQDGDQESARSAFSIALTGGVGQFEGYCATYKGKPKWWEVIVTPILAADGQVSEILSVSRDITDRKQAETIFQVQQAAIQQQLGEIEFIYRAAPVGMSLGDANMQYVRINEQLAQINGMPAAAHIGLTIREVLPELADQLEPLYRHVMESGEPSINLEISGVVPSQPGVERQWLLSYYPQKDAEERTIGVNSIVQEITNRKQAEIALQIGEELFRSTFEYSSVGLAHVALDGSWMRVNHKLCEILGYGSEELLATTFQAITEPEDLAEDMALVQQLVNGEINEYTLEKRYIHKQGHHVWANLTVSLIRTIAPDGKLGTPKHFVSAVQDITDRKQAQAQLEERNKELDSFVYVVSHDLKAPLRAVANLSQWIEEDLDGQLTPDTRSQMSLLRSRVNRMAATIDGLLDYARCARSEDEIELVDLTKLLSDVIDSVDPPSTFIIHLPTEPPTFFTRRTPLFQVLFNLVSNGIKHHHSKAGTVQISIENHGDFYKFAVTDDGLGIAPEYQAQIFEIFQAVNPQNRSDSTGIGLAIVKKLVEAEGGSIWLESEVGRGTAFYFTWFQR